MKALEPINKRFTGWGAIFCLHFLTVRNDDGGRPANNGNDNNNHNINDVDDNAYENENVSKQFKLLMENEINKEKIDSPPFIVISQPAPFVLNVLDVRM